MRMNSPTKDIKNLNECPSQCWMSPFGGLEDVTRLDRTENNTFWDNPVAKLKKGKVFYLLFAIDNRYQFAINYYNRDLRTQDRVLFKSPVGDAICPQDISIWLRFCKEWIKYSLKNKG